MTFTTTIGNVISTNNSTETPLGVSGSFTGTADNVTRYNSVLVTIDTDTKSASEGLTLQFSADGKTWDVSSAVTYTQPITLPVTRKYFRLSYINGTVAQTVFNLQTKFSLISENVKLSSSLIDSFNRVRVSEPFTIIDGSSILGKNFTSVYEDATGSSTSTADLKSSSIIMSTTGSGNVTRQTRKRGVYQPAKSLLIYMTGVLNLANNDSTVTSRIGYYDANNGFYFQYVNGVMSIVKRTSVTGSVVETVVTQQNWDRNLVNLDPSKTLIFYINLEWLGVGFVELGVVINAQLIPLHRFRNSNLNTTPYTQTASLPVHYEISSTGGSGSMSMICYSVISEGGFNPIGSQFTCNNALSTKNSAGNLRPLIILQMRAGSPYDIVTAVIGSISVISTSGANSLVEVYKFSDKLLGDVITAGNTDFIDVDTDNSAMRYNVGADAIQPLNGILIASEYFANNQDNLNITGDENFLATNPVGQSEFLAVCVSALGGNESYAASVNWTEYV